MDMGRRVISVDTAGLASATAVWRRPVEGPSVHLVACSRFPVAGITWRWSTGPWMLTVVCRGTFVLQQDRVVPAAIQDAPVNGDRGYPAGAGAGLYAPSDLVPMKPLVDVLVVGPPGPQAGSIGRASFAKIAVGEIEKRVELSTADARGILNPIYRGLGPVARTAPSQRGTGAFQPDAKADDWQGRVLPADFNPAVFGVAPRDQRLRTLRDDEPITLENLHPQYPQFRTRPPGFRPVATVEAGGAHRNILVCAPIPCDRALPGDLSGDLARTTPPSRGRQGPGARRPRRVGAVEQAKGTHRGHGRRRQSFSNPPSLSKPRHAATTGLLPARLALCAEPDTSAGLRPSSCCGRAAAVHSLVATGAQRTAKRIGASRLEVPVCTPRAAAICLARREPLGSGSSGLGSGAVLRRGAGRAAGSHPHPSARRPTQGRPRTRRIRPRRGIGGSPDVALRDGALGAGGAFAKPQFRRAPRRRRDGRFGRAA